MLASLQLFLIATSYKQETSKPTEYSKFASGKKLVDPVPSQNGMFRIYVPSTVSAAAIMAYQAANDTLCLVTTLLFLHFLKRCLEVAFLHHYSGTMPKANANQIGTYYTLVTLLVALTATPLYGIKSEHLQQIGFALFIIGELGNFYHHYILRLLRSESKSGTAETSGASHYAPPTGGLFRYVATPHYLCELIAWFGMACVAQQVHAFLVFGSMGSYLAGRAVMTNLLYQERFSKEEWPRSRNALVPGIF